MRLGIRHVHGTELRIGRRRLRRSALGVVLELAEFLRAAASSGDLGGPLDGGFARRQFQDAEAAVELPGLGVRFVRDGPSAATIDGATPSLMPPPNT
jgi:hypothetical protein